MRVTHTHNSTETTSSPRAKTNKHYTSSSGSSATWAWRAAHSAPLARLRRCALLAQQRALDGRGGGGGVNPSLFVWRLARSAPSSIRHEHLNSWRARACTAVACVARPIARLHARWQTRASSPALTCAAFVSSQSNCRATTVAVAVAAKPLTRAGRQRARHRWRCASRTQRRIRIASHRR